MRCRPDQPWSALRSFDGLIGWGEVNAARITTPIIETVLAPVLTTCDFDGSYAGLEAICARLAKALCSRTGGYGMEALSGVDLALWDIAGKMAGKPISSLLGATEATVPAYVGGEPRAALIDAGFRAFEFQAGLETLETFDRFRAEFGKSIDIGVDAHGRFDADAAAAFGRELDARRAMWFAAPLPPDDPWTHAAISRRFRTPIALGSGYGTRAELAAFFREGAMKILQPDLGRCGMTEGLRIAQLAAKNGVSVIPRLGGASHGPRAAAAVHFAAAMHCNLLEYAPDVIDRLDEIRIRDARYVVPQRPGLGVTVRLP